MPDTYKYSLKTDVVRDVISDKNYWRVFSPLSRSLLQHICWIFLTQNATKHIWNKYHMTCIREPWERSETSGACLNERHLCGTPVLSPTEEL